MTVLLIGRDTDLHIDAVLLKLKMCGTSWIRVDPTRVVQRDTQLKATWDGRQSTSIIDTYAGSIIPSEITGVLCRYALEAIDSSTTDPLARFGEAEFWTTFRGILLHIGDHRWINDPFVEARADHKPFQMFTARSVGLKVPPTLISQDAAALRAFAAIHGACVIKPISDVGLARSSQSYFNELPSSLNDNAPYCSFTARFDPATLDRSEIDLSSPVLLQAEIPAKTDLRVTIVDDRVFAAEITQFGPGQTIDVRNSESTALAAADIGVTADAVRSLVRRLGLRFAACDFVRGTDGLFFLEANVSGNWLWTENAADLQISQALAVALTEEACSDSASSFR
ncbi:MAG: hypothetical protein ABI375_00360 [Rudaea sp.]